MAKTNPIGVRFRTDILEDLKTKFKIDSPQKALVFMERFYVQYSGKISILDVLREDTKKKMAPEAEFMGESIPEGLAGLQLAVWKNNIKVKAKDAAKLKK